MIKTTDQLYHHSLLLIFIMNYRQKLGRTGEELARQYLAAKGHNILNSNVKISYKEIDIVCIKDGILIFVEVKTRTNTNFGSAEEVFSRAKTKNLKMAISLYLNRFHHNYRDIRLDMISVDINIINKTAKIKHYKDIG